MKTPKQIEHPELDAATYTLFAAAKEFAHASDDDMGNKPSKATVAKMQALLEAAMGYSNARRSFAAAMTRTTAIVNGCDCVIGPDGRHGPFCNRPRKR